MIIMYSSKARSASDSSSKGGKGPGETLDLSLLFAPSLFLAGVIFLCCSSVRKDSEKTYKKARE